MNFKLHQFPVPADSVEDSAIGWAVIVTKYQNQWMFVQHWNRETFEVPGGTREIGESVLDCAMRELYEETGSVTFKLYPLEVYSIKHPDNSLSYGQLFFADVSEMEALQPNSEIEEVALIDEHPDNLTYPSVHTALFERAAEFSQRLIQ